MFGDPFLRTMDYLSHAVQHRLAPILSYLPRTHASLVSLEKRKQKKRNSARSKPQPAAVEFASMLPEWLCLSRLVMVVVSVRWYHVTIKPLIVIMPSEVRIVIEPYGVVPVLRIRVLRVVPVLGIPV